MNKQLFSIGKWSHHIQPTETGTVRTINRGSMRIATLTHLSIEESEANANLIAAAPRLYNALDNLRLWVTFNTGECPAELVEAIAALKEANPQQTKEFIP